jgi:hypothetical protein
MATPEKSLERYAEPTIVGPGLWYEIHHKAHQATTKEAKIEFKRYMQELADGRMLCNTCRPHLEEYLRKNPIDVDLVLLNKEGQDITMFKYSWKFHNDVNARLGKPFMPFDTAWKFFHHPEACSTTCGRTAH